MVECAWLSANDSVPLTEYWYAFCVYHLQALRIPFAKRAVRAYIDEVLANCVGPGAMKAHEVRLMNADRKKELRDSYKTKPVIGGVCCIRCSGNQRVYLQSTRNIEGLRHRYDFAISTGTPPDPSLRSETEKYGTESFSFTVLDEIRKSASQTDKEFADDIDALYEMWLAKLEAGDFA